MFVSILPYHDTTAIWTFFMGQDLVIKIKFNFLVPPTLRAVPQNGQVSARKGSTVTLECKASGNPGIYEV